MNTLADILSALESYHATVTPDLWGALERAMDEVEYVMEREKERVLARAQAFSRAAISSAVGL